MRLTADLINASLSYLNPLKERELDLRGGLLGWAGGKQRGRSPRARDREPSFHADTEISVAGHRIPQIENLGVAGVSLFFFLSHVPCPMSHVP